MEYLGVGFKIRVYGMGGFGLSIVARGKHFS